MAEMTGTELIAAERRRQIEAEGWTPEHDAHHGGGELGRAAAAYALYCSPGLPPQHAGIYWPRDWKFKRAGRVRMLVKAGALIAAEIDRRLAAGEGHQ